MEDYLNKLAYNGELYHYTDFNGYKKILHPYNEFSDSEYEFPKDCIALQFKRIDLMTKNDNKERRHIKDLISKLLKNCSNAGLSEDFIKIVEKHELTDEAFSSIKTNKIHPILGNEIIKWDISPCDYYVACFSTNPNNKHIIKTFGSTYIFSFKKWFSVQPDSLTDYNLSHFHPFSSLKNAFLAFDVKKVVYTEQQLSELLLGELLFIQQSHSDTENMETEIQDLYAKYDAFVKSEEYQLEEEVRFVVSIPKKYNAEDLKKYSIFFKEYQPVDGCGNNEPIPNGLMFLPIDKALFLKEIRAL